MKTHTIWKFPLPYKHRDVLGIQVPVGAEVLHVNFDGSGELVVWVRVDPSETTLLNLEVAVIGTGLPIPEGFTKYINTFITGVFVFHAFVKETS